MQTYLLRKKDTWYFSRRVPIELKPYESREYIRFSLKTDSKKKAAKLACLENASLENLWAKLLLTEHPKNSPYRQLVDRANLLGFSYIPLSDLANGDFQEISSRLLYLEQQLCKPKQVEALLGTEPVPEVTIKSAFKKYIEIRSDVKIDKSEYQYRQWFNPVRLAVNNLISIIGNRNISALTQDDLLAVRKHYIERIEKRTLKAATANKHFGAMKMVIKTSAKYFKIKTLDVDHIFDEISFEDDTASRPPFSTEHILNVLLKPENLIGLDREYKMMLNVFAETGVHIDEQLAVRPENIFLDNEIPYIKITSHFKDKLKTKHRERDMPLVGFALDAFKEFPQGFSHLPKNAHQITTEIGKYLKKHELLESEKHSAYSLRHSFQDRLTNQDCPDRIQTDLMGHAFDDRPKYGTGGTLKKKHDWLKKIQLKPE